MPSYSLKENLDLPSRQRLWEVYEAQLIPAHDRIKISGFDGGLFIHASVMERVSPIVREHIENNPECIIEYTNTNTRTVCSLSLTFLAELVYQNNVRVPEVLVTDFMNICGYFEIETRILEEIPENVENQSRQSEEHEDNDNSGKITCANYSDSSSDESSYFRYTDDCSDKTDDDKDSNCSSNKSYYITAYLRNKRYKYDYGSGCSDDGILPVVDEADSCSETNFYDNHCVITSTEVNSSSDTNIDDVTHSVMNSAEVNSCSDTSVEDVVYPVINSKEVHSCSGRNFDDTSYAKNSTKVNCSDTNCEDGTWKTYGVPNDDDCPAGDVACPTGDDDIEPADDGESSSDES